MYICGAQQYGYAYTRPEYSAPIGAPTGSMIQDPSGAYTRAFTNGLALVNPSGAHAAQVAIAPNMYADLYGSVITTSSVSLSPASGLVLLKRP
jgi:hypothetical protein